MRLRTCQRIQGVGVLAQRNDEPKVGLSGFLNDVTVVARGVREERCGFPSAPGLYVNTGGDTARIDY